MADSESQPDQGGWHSVLACSGTVCTASLMTPAQIAGTQKLAREWQAAFNARQEQGRLMITRPIPAVCVVLVLLVSGAAGACSGGLERVSSPCPSGQELWEERYGPTSIKARGCVGIDSEDNYRRQGGWEFFHPNGQKEAEGSYVDGFHSGNTGTSGIPIDGREGAWATWHEDGQKKQESTYRDGQREGLATEWHENGKKKAERTYHDRKRKGLATQWYENGQKELETTSPTARARRPQPGMRMATRSAN
jgi:hypothetical protein